MPKLIIEKLSKSFDKNVLFENLTISLNAGDYVIVHGDNGAGKTTLLKIIAGLIKQDQGTLTFRVLKKNWLSNCKFRQFYSRLTAHDNLILSWFERFLIKIARSLFLITFAMLNWIMVS